LSLGAVRLTGGLPGGFPGDLGADARSQTESHHHDPRTAHVSARRPDAAAVFISCGGGAVAAAASTTTAQAISTPAATDILRVGSLKLELINPTARRGDRSLDLLPRKFRLLEYMMQRCGQVLTRAKLLEDVWNYKFIPETTILVDVHMGRLRCKVDGPDEAPLIRTVRGAGFILDATGRVPAMREGPMSDNIVTFPSLSPKRQRSNPISSEPREDEDPANSRADWRSRERIREDIDLHIAARDAYGKAVACEVAAESQNLPPAQIEEARQRTAQAFQEMQCRGRALVIVMPTEHKVLVDLLLYLEKNFSVLPQEWPVTGIRLVVANHAPQPP
jgi:DNA-binding winged helix-turn-helix (wHTH) protein